jgi:hypothetical protein
MSRRENSDIIYSLLESSPRRPTRQTGVTAAEGESTNAGPARAAFRCYIRPHMLKRHIESTPPEDP